MTMIVEMREYRLKPGTRAQILSIFPTKLFPECKRIGMKVAGIVTLKVFRKACPTPSEVSTRS